MSVIPEVWQATQEQIFYQYFRKHRNIAPIQANRQLLEQYLDSQLWQLNLENLERAAIALEPNLAPNKDFMEPALPTPLVEQQTSAEESAAEIKKPYTAMTIEELKEQVRAEQPEKYKKYRYQEVKPMPASLTPEYIQGLSQDKKLQLIYKFGSRAFNDRMARRS